MNPFRHFGRTHLTGDQPIARPPPTEDNTTQRIKKADMHQCLERDSKPWSHCFYTFHLVSWSSDQRLSCFQSNQQPIINAVQRAYRLIDSIVIVIDTAPWFT